MTMAYFWLNQRSDSVYRSTEGEVYHYRGNIPGSKKLSEGDQFVYYKPSESTLAGTGTIGSIRKEDNRPDGVGYNVLIEYFADIVNYRSFDPAVDALDVSNQVSFLREKEGLRGVPQHSIYKISEDDFYTILNTAGVVP